jgi:hypothetical protein
MMPGYVWHVQRLCLEYYQYKKETENMYYLPRLRKCVPKEKRYSTIDFEILKQFQSGAKPNQLYVM